MGTVNPTLTVDYDEEEEEAVRGVARRVQGAGSHYEDLEKYDHLMTTADTREGVTYEKMAPGVRIMPSGGGGGGSGLQYDYAAV